jgi:hypothetical protein
LKRHIAAWGVGTLALTSLWVIKQSRANGALESFGHEGEPGQWNPTLSALAVGIWGLIVGIMALRVHFERPVSEAEIDRDVARRTGAVGNEIPASRELRRFSLAQLERIGQLKFRAASWLLGMAVLTPLWALIEWQDDGAFERFSNDSQPGDWEPWILYIGGTWALVMVLQALRMYADRPADDAQIE